MVSMEIMELTALKDRKAVKEILEPMALKGLRDPPETQVHQVNRDNRALPVIKERLETRETLV